NAFQGLSVSISGDGNTVIVGGPFDGPEGAAWVWTRSAGVWIQQGPKLVGSGPVGNADQGSSVALSADGNTAILAGVEDNDFGGAAIWIWTRSRDVWTQQGPKLITSGAEHPSAWGIKSVALSADGDTAIIGGRDALGHNAAAWVWTRN